MLSRKWVDFYFFFFHFAVVPISAVMILAVFVKNGNDYILNTVWKNIKFSSLVTEANEGILCLCVLLAEKEY